MPALGEAIAPGHFQWVGKGGACLRVPWGMVMACVGVGMMEEGVGEGGVEGRGRLAVKV